MAKRETLEVRSSNKKQMEKMIKRIKWLYKYDSRIQDSLYVQQKIFFGKKTLEFLDKFSQDEAIKPQTIFKMVSRIQQLN